MSNARGWLPTLRYSPINGIIVNWGIGSEPFSMCCMPQPKCDTPSPAPDTTGACACNELPLPEHVNTADWYVWTPEIVAGISNASADMASSYARRAAIEFARKTRVLQRQLAVRLEPGIFRYQLQPFPDEAVQGVLHIESAQGSCNCECETGAVDLGNVHIDIAKQEFVIEPTRNACGCHMGHSHGPKAILVTVWAAPTEDASVHDVFLWDQYRREITLGARADFIMEAHSFGSYQTQRGYANYRGDEMMYRRAERLKQEFVVAMRKAKVEAVTHNAIDTHEPRGMFDKHCCTTTLRR